MIQKKRKRVGEKKPASGWFISLHFDFADAIIGSRYCRYYGSVEATLAFGKSSLAM